MVNLFVYRNDIINSGFTAIEDGDCRVCIFNNNGEKYGCKVVAAHNEMLDKVNKQSTSVGNIIEAICAPDKDESNYDNCYFTCDKNTLDDKLKVLASMIESRLLISNAHG